MGLTKIVVLTVLLLVTLEAKSLPAEPMVSNDESQLRAERHISYSMCNTVLLAVHKCSYLFSFSLQPPV